MAIGGEGPFNYIGNVMAEWNMKQILRLLEAGGKVTIIIEIPPRGETEADDENGQRKNPEGTNAGGASDDAGGTDGGAASE